MFRDRSHGGELLGGVLERYRGAAPVVLGLARGGVPVAAEVAARLGAPLDVLVVRKIGAPFQREYAMGAVAEGSGLYVNARAAALVGMSEAEIAELAGGERDEIARRVAAYRGGRDLPDVSGRTVLLVDDGVATGATARAACRSLRDLGAARVVLAAPVIAAQTAPELRDDFDDVVAVELPPDFLAVSAWYGEFPQVSDREVVACLERARRGAAPGSGGQPDATNSDAWWDEDWTHSGEIATSAADSLDEVRIPIPELEGRGDALTGSLAVPRAPRGLVIFVHGSGSSRSSPRNQRVARLLQRRGLATLLFDLLTPEEAAEDERTMELRFDVELLARRVVEVTRWAAEDPRTCELPVAYFGASTGAAAALEAAAVEGGRVAAIVSRGGRPDLVSGPTLEHVSAPVLLLVGERDAEVLELNRWAASQLGFVKLVVVGGASHLFEEHGALAVVARAAAKWFETHLAAAPTPPGLTPRSAVRPRRWGSDPKMEGPLRKRPFVAQE